MVYNHLDNIGGYTVLLVAPHGGMIRGHPPLGFFFWVLLFPSPLPLWVMVNLYIFWCFVCFWICRWWAGHVGEEDIIFVIPMYDNNILFVVHVQRKLNVTLS